MRLVLFMLCAVIAATTACKLEASSNSGNANANASKSADQSTASTTSPNSDPQSTCSLKLAAAPAISGVGLGMTADEVLAAFPGSKDDPEVQAFLKRPPSPFGVSELFIRASKFQTNGAAGVGDVTNIAITLLDGRVYTLHVSYNGPQYAHVDKFVTSFLA
ncbi:MAG TPA: hypothetical protein VE863_16765, partial [Pyrinomonadaceae bacterium]|nr:hypothetical protein [Pyrinomonadaceae bacterium]